MHHVLPSAFGACSRDAPMRSTRMVAAVIKTFPRVIDEHELLITKKPDLRQRTIGLGTLTPRIANGLTGPPGRWRWEVGCPYDLRKAQPYSSYDHFGLRCPIVAPATSTTATWCACRRCAD